MGRFEGGGGSVSRCLGIYLLIRKRNNDMTLRHIVIYILQCNIYFTRREHVDITLICHMKITLPCDVKFILQCHIEYSRQFFPNCYMKFT